jgi:hypothetical protein
VLQSNYSASAQGTTHGTSAPYLALLSAGVLLLLLLLTLFPNASLKLLPSALGGPSLNFSPIPPLTSKT